MNQNEHTKEIEMSQNENTNDIYQMAADLQEYVDQLKLTMKYISEQTGIPIKKVRRFFDLTDEGISQNLYSEYWEIGVEIKNFLYTCLKSNSFSLMKDGKFYDIHKKLRKEFPFNSNQQVSQIKSKIHKIFERQRIENSSEFLEFCINQYGIDQVQDMAEKHLALHEQLHMLYAELPYYNDLFTSGRTIVIDYDADGQVIEKSIPLSSEEYTQYQEEYQELITKIKILKEKISSFEKDYSNFCLYRNSSYNLSYSMQKRQEKALKKIHTHSIAEENFKFNVDQQRAILEMYFEACTDNNGYLLPDHFGSGIQLSILVEEEITFVRSQGAKLNHWAAFHGIRKVRPWVTKENLKSYHYGDKLPETDKSDPIYQFIAEHKRVFFHDSSIKHVSDILKMIKDLPDKVKEQVLDLLTFSIVIPESEKDYEYYKTISEYFDILSLRSTVADRSKYSKEQIYRIVYEISAESDGAILFSNDLVEQAFLLIKQKTADWVWQMYISYYYFKYREIDSLIQYIEVKTKEYSNMEI